MCREWNWDDIRMGNSKCNGHIAVKSGSGKNREKKHQTHYEIIIKAKNYFLRFNASLRMRGIYMKNKCFLTIYI